MSNQQEKNTIHSDRQSVSITDKYNDSATAIYHHSPIRLIYLWDGLARKASAKTLSSWVALSLTLDGRDKITKTIQYTCRLIVWYYTSIAKTSKSISQPYKNLQLALTQARRAYRLGRFLVEFERLRGTIRSMITQANRPLLLDRWFRSNNSSSTVPKSSSTYDKASETATVTALWTSVGISCKMLGLAGFWFGDNVFFLSSTGFLKNGGNQAKWKRFAERSYFFAAIAGLFVSYRGIIFHLAKSQEAQDHVEFLHRKCLSDKSGNEKYDGTSRRGDSSINEILGREEAIGSGSVNYELRGELEDASFDLSEARGRQFVSFLGMLKVSEANFFRTSYQGDVMKH